MVVNPAVWILTVSCVFFTGVTLVKEALDKRYAVGPIRLLSQDVEVKIASSYRFRSRDGISYKEYKNVGVTYYAKGEPTVPGVTMRSGRHVYDGAIAVSRDIWGSLAVPGDLIFVKATGRWYRVEDTMGPQYNMRIDIYTHSMEIAKSGSFRSDIIILRQPYE